MVSTQRQQMKKDIIKYFIKTGKTIRLRFIKNLAPIPTGRDDAIDSSRLEKNIDSMPMTHNNA